MPTYAYACSACEHAFDIRQSFSDEALTTCPLCEQVSLRKVFSPVGVVFKGSGFYRNDSRAANKGKAAGSGRPAAPVTASADSSPNSPKGDSSTSTPAMTGASAEAAGKGSSSSSSTSSSSGSGSATPAA